MAEQLTREQIAEAADIHVVPPRYIRNAPIDRTFELPTRLYVATVGLFLAYIALMAKGFAHPEMVLPAAIFVLFVVAGFGVPGIWTRLAPENPARATSWARFKQDGIMTPFGRTSARDATVQVLILPVLIFLWGVIAVTIAALV
ncbi:hypothetical protein [Aurantiacibacter aquimixticola]|uniref:Uncharacterized protein n=1 Tax=Aurantiacibacter aquimixticola TaxID=1958945 RepID=A0A419RQG8_9SPHN|nr:hypothetical protein [Aurantiacibacter aquimixticola]RJY08010.1 hypothetical protein D6201_00360 [Aurantiacibacter aquimixticola]